MSFRIKERKSVKDTGKTTSDESREKRHDDLKSLRKELNEERLQKRRGQLEENYNFTDEQLATAASKLGKMDEKIDEPSILSGCQILRRDLSEGKPESYVRIKPHIPRLCQ